MMRQMLHDQGQGLVAVLHVKSVDCSTVSVSTHATSWESKDSTGRSDNAPILAQHAEQEALLSTENVLPRHGILAWNLDHSVRKEPAGELSLFSEEKCLSLPEQYSTSVLERQIYA